MSMNVSSAGSKSQQRTTGALFAVVGMSAYYLPVTKDRFVRTAFNIMKNQTEDTIEILNNTAIAVSKNKLKPEDKVFLQQNNVEENVNAINQKIAQLKKSITDNGAVKSVKQQFADNFMSFKKSEAAMGNTASKAFSKIRWTNFAWGAAIGLVLGKFIASRTSA